MDLFGNFEESESYSEEEYTGAETTNDTSVNIITSDALYIKQGNTYLTNDHMALFHMFNIPVKVVDGFLHTLRTTLIVEHVNDIKDDDFAILIKLYEKDRLFCSDSDVMSKYMYIIKEHLHS